MIDSHLRYKKPTFGGGHHKSISVIDNQRDMMGNKNKMQGIGVDNAWSPRKRYARYNRDSVTSSLRDASGGADEESPPKPYMGSLERLGNKHITNFLAKKTAARGTIIKEGADKLDPGYLYANARNSPFAQRPTSLSIFPHIGMISNKNTYVTHNTVD